MEPKMAFAGVMLKTSFVRFMTWMAIFNEESVTSRPARFVVWTHHVATRKWSSLLAAEKDTGGDGDTRPAGDVPSRSNEAV